VYVIESTVASLLEKYNAFFNGPLFSIQSCQLTGLWTIFGHIPKREESPVKLSSQIKPISYLKAHAAEIVRKLNERQETMVITQNGEAKEVIQDIKSFEQTQETMALLKILALGTRQISEGKVLAAEDVIKRLRKRRETD